MDEKNLAEVKRAKAAIKHAVDKTTATPGVAIAALMQAILDAAMQFPPEEREFVINGVATSLKDVLSATVHYYPEEFGKATTKQ